mmetsp:Transcript_24500/g.45310  ORF Transcript_24500/g.45310 Transcript_24500/m.45310 type:complete len:142 (+) Transcript_24500:801-1226(+)
MSCVIPAAALVAWASENCDVAQHLALLLRVTLCGMRRMTGQNPMVPPKYSFVAQSINNHIIGIRDRQNSLLAPTEFDFGDLGSATAEICPLHSDNEIMTELGMVVDSRVQTDCPCCYCHQWHTITSVWSSTFVFSSLANLP